MWHPFCLVNVRRFFAQRNSPFDMGDFRVLLPALRSYMLSLGRFITSPRLACRPQLASPSPQQPRFILGTVCDIGNYMNFSCGLVVPMLRAVVALVCKCYCRGINRVDVAELEVGGGRCVSFLSVQLKS